MNILNVSTNVAGFRAVPYECLLAFRYLFTSANFLYSLSLYFCFLILFVTL